MTKLTIIGNGYTAQFLSKEALKKGFNVSIITRNILEPKKNIHYYNFYDSNNIVKKLAKENIISTVPPNENGIDPIIEKYKKPISLNDSKINLSVSTPVSWEASSNKKPPLSVSVKSSVIGAYSFKSKSLKLDQFEREVDTKLLSINYPH